jgi:hypothetical protein
MELIFMKIWFTAFLTSMDDYKENIYINVLFVVTIIDENKT